jgi:hypothetical protein
MQAVKLDSSAQGDIAGDAGWAKANLRFEAGRAYNDLANCLRVLERHPDFKGRFKFNEMLSKVLDRGAVMVEWRINEIAAELQERFLPEISPETVGRALVIAGNRSAK